MAAGSMFCVRPRAGEARIIAICVGDRRIANAIADLARENFPMAKVFAAPMTASTPSTCWSAASTTRFANSKLALIFGGAALVELRGDPDRAQEVVDHVRQLDSDRLAIQQAGGAPPPFYQPSAPRLAPEPLVKPAGKSQGLTKESQDIVDHMADRTANHLSDQMADHAAN